MRSRSILLTNAVLFLVCFLAVDSVKADIVYPARLDMTESQTGIFEILFVLPVMNGQVLKAQPILPDFCTPLNEPAISGDSNKREMRWLVNCDGNRLYGQKIGVEGLLGSQVDILLSIRTRDGRLYESKLSPINAFYLVPVPPGKSQLISRAILTGLRSILTFWALYFLFTAMAPLFSRRQVMVLLLTFWSGYIFGSQFGAQDLLIIPAYSSIIIALVLTLLLGILQIGGKYNLQWEGSTCLLAVFLGIIYGSASADIQPPPELAFTEKQWMQVFMYSGVLLGLCLIYYVCKEFRFGLEYLLNRFGSREASSRIANVFCVIALGCLLYELTLFWAIPSSLPDIPILVLIFIGVAAVWLSSTLSGRTLFLSFYLIGFMGLGLIVGFMYLPDDVSRMLVYAVLLGWIVFYFFDQRQPQIISLAMVAVGAMAGGKYLGGFASDQLSYAVGQSAGFLILLVFLFIILFRVFSNDYLQYKPKNIPPLYICLPIIFPLLVLRWHDYAQDYIPDWFSESAMGFWQLPLLSLLLLLLGLYSWPRRRAIHDQMNISRRSPVYSMLMITLAIILVPYGNLKAANPFFEPHVLSSEDATKVLERTLSNTYQAFNMKGEVQLFEQLSENVDADLIDDIYLDSRRRLNAGVREGAEVTVRNVSILDVGEVTQGQKLEEGLLYPVEWVVIARVKHLQHIHYRKNRYMGFIEIKTDEDLWKISKIILTSEDRTIVPNIPQ